MGSKAFFYKVSEYDQETSQSHTADQPRHREEELQNTECHKTSGGKFKKSDQLSFPIKLIAKIE